MSRHVAVFTAALAAALAGCYRGGAPAPAELPSGTAPPSSAGSCGLHDDLDSPITDVAPHARLRSQIDGPLDAREQRRWVGAPIPGYVATKLGTLELFILDDTTDGKLALYRDPYDASSCKLATSDNCSYVARLYTSDGALAWSLPLARVMSRADHLEVQDIRYADGVLYFNEACQSYSKESGGTCSELVAVDPRAGRVRWRTPPLTSNSRFVVRGCYIVAGYGFTAEADSISVIDRATGRVLQHEAVPKMPEGYELRGRDRLDVRLSSGQHLAWRLASFDDRGGNARLIAMSPAEAGYGGDGYGGAGYGGAGYGSP